MDIKLGYFYNIINNGYNRNRLLLYFAHNCLRFKLFDPALMPSNKKTTNMGGYYRCLGDPVIYQEDVNGEVKSIIFLSDLQTFDNRDEIMGFTIGEPDLVNKCTTLYYDGKDVFADEKLTSELLFYKSVIHHYAVRKKVWFLRHEADPKILIDPCLKYVKQIKTYIDTIDIAEILKDLKVTVHDHYRNKIGGDDSYYIDREASVSSQLAYSDEYLKTVIGIGHHNIYSDSGYTSNLKAYAKDFIEENPLGEYDGELLEKEKTKIIASYSKEEHMGYLLSKRFIEREYNRAYRLPEWEKALPDAEKVLMDDFHFGAVSNDGRRFETKMYNMGSLCGDAAIKELEKINESIRESTTYIHNYL